MRVGILFGGPSREREISFAGGRTVYDNLDKTLFEPVPIFIDSRQQFILLDWQYLYKGTIRDFYPPNAYLPDTPNDFQVYIESLHDLPKEKFEEIAFKVGRPIKPEDLPNLIDVVFLTLHGFYGEDGQIQGLLEHLGIPYTGSGIFPSAFGMNKALQKRIMKATGWPVPAFVTVPRSDWISGDTSTIYKQAKEEIGFPLVIRPANQGSSIGVHILHVDDPAGFAKAIDLAFFRETVGPTHWNSLSFEAKVSTVRSLCDIREGLGLPVTWGQETIYHPEDLLSRLNQHFEQSEEEVLLEALDGEAEVVVEGFIEGKEFSCIVIRNEDEQGQLSEPVALPPTEIRKGNEVFDYRSKYLAGLSRKVTPIDLPDEQIEAIRRECKKLFAQFDFHVYARIDGFFKADGTIYLNDPNTTSGMLPSSFFFHQAAEIGLNPSQFLTYILRTSLAETVKRQTRPYHYQELLAQLDRSLAEKHLHESEKSKVGVVLGGYSTERHISVESGRNIYEKLAASADYEPTPIFLRGTSDDWKLWQIPINLLLKDNADDISDKIGSFKYHPVVERIKTSCSAITKKYATVGYQFEPSEIPLIELPGQIQFAFIALHGRPGEDGAFQRELERIGIPYNGSGPDSSQLTIDKHKTNEILAQHGFKVARQFLVERGRFEKDPNGVLDEVAQSMGWPVIAKPVDDGCSSAVKKITSREGLRAFLETIFRDHELIGETQAKVLKLKPKEEFPIKQYALVETLISKADASEFLEVTGGMLIESGEEPSFEVFEPSEALATDSVLSLEEKFLAGEGQNITPARFAKDANRYQRISEQVKNDLKRAAQILGVEGYCRIDAFVRIYPDDRVETLIIEVNSLPGMTPATCIFHQAALNGYKPFDFIHRIIQFGYERAKEEFSGN